MIEISSSKNLLIKEIKGLHKKKDRWASNLFIMEGIKLIDEAINNNVIIKNIIYTDKLLMSNEGLDFFNRLNTLGKMIKVSENIFKEISDTENSQGVLATGFFVIRNNVEQFDNSNQFLLFLDGIQDPGNMGTIIRSADAFKVDGIVIGDNCVDTYNPKVVRATMGSIFRVPLYFVKDSIDNLMQFKNNNFKIYATSLEGSVSNYDINYDDKFIIIIGNESRGVDANIIQIADKLIKIPMPGNAESLNVGVAASIIMYEGMKQLGKKS